MGYGIAIAFVGFSLLGYNLYRSIHNRKIVQYPLLLILISSFLLYAFHDIGAKVAPQKFEMLNSKNSKVVFDFDKPQTVTKFAYYVGIEDNSKFYLEYFEKNKWKILYKYDENFPFSFRWNSIDLNATTTSKVRLHLTKGKVMLGEVRFMQDHKPIKMTSSKVLLSDDPTIKVDTTYFGGMFFDELYHSRTAYEILHGLRVYETVHPYLGKMLIVPGIKLFGMTPFGWRFTNVLFGTLFIVVSYYFSLMLFRKKLLAFSAALMMSYSFMHFTQVRIGLIDTFGVLLVFISYHFLYRFILKQRLSAMLLSGLFFGLASSVKWSAVFASIGFLLIALYLLFSKYPLKRQFTGYRLILYGLLSYLGVGGLIYTLSFYDIYMQTGTFQAIIDYQTNMYSYHSGLKATHAYGSEWWSWPLDIKPMCYYRQIEDGIFSSITVFGNPAIFWVGSMAMVYLLYKVILKRTLEAVFILSAFVGLYLPYMFINRVMFIYHFYYAVPFMILALVYLWKDLIEYSSKSTKYLLLFLAIVVGLFLLFYPVLSGYKVSLGYINNYLVWFKGWWL
jgi:dolichyl-phosphate-mannose--protein O-mannosyl transferase